MNLDRAKMTSQLYPEKIDDRRRLWQIQAMSEASATWTLFDGERRMAAGSPSQVAVAAHEGAGGAHEGPLLVFDDASGKVVDLDLRGAADEVAARYTPQAAP